VSLVLRTGLALALTAGLLANCGKRSPEAARIASASETTSSLGEPAETATETPAAAPAGLALRETKPIDAYLVLGGKIKTCWFNPTGPLLPRHMYRADVSPDGDNAKIAVYEMTREKRPGAIAYLIVLQQETGYTSVKTQNRKMPKDAAARLRHDVERWTHGDESCKSASAAR
jgi:hypothetical protein